MNQITIILVHAGQGSIPSHVRENLELTCQIAKKSRVIFLANEINRNHFNQIIQSLGMLALGVEFFSIESIPRSEVTQAFENHSSLDRCFRDGFWFYASNRFLILADYIAHSKIENVLHIENDYVLYFDPSDKYQAFNDFADFAVPLDRIRAIPGIVWIKNSMVANSVAQYIAENSNLDDMANLGQFCLKNLDGFAKSLPTLPSAYARERGLDANKYSNGIDLFGGIFDGAAIGQYLGGIHRMNNPADTTFFLNESSDLNLNDFSFAWDVSNGILHPTLSYDDSKTTILGLHIHSKFLSGFSPFNHGVPANEDSVVTGERLQSICDITISSPSITAFHGIENIRSKKMVEIEEDSQKNLLPPSPALVQEIANSKVIFVYTHLIPYFKYYIAPRMQSEFTLVTHNSDYPVTVMDLQLLNHPHLKRWYAQNPEFSHAKLSALPIGLQNKQWGKEKISELLQAGKNISKSKLLYVNFSADTHPSRVEAIKVAKELRYATIETGVPYKEYLTQLTKHKFCLCPRGNGIDTHRFWEAQYLGCIPVVLYRDWTPGYSELPVLLLDQWEDLAELDLEKTYIVILNKRYSRLGLNFRFHERQILS
jgi:hypothetical protein